MCPKEGSDIGASKLIPSLFLPFLAQRPQLKNEQGISNLPGEGGVRVGCIRHAMLRPLMEKIT